jgi:HlyD family secretion protein
MGCVAWRRRRGSLAAFGTITRVALAAVVLAAAGGVAWLAMPRASPAPAPGMLFGNVELRQIDLAFNAEGSVRGMAKREGDAVHAGDLVAELDDATFVNAQGLAVAQRDAAKAKLDLLLAGTRPEEIDRARANVANVQATVARAEVTFTRQEDLLNRKVASQQAYDDALMTRDSARAALAHYQAALAQAVAGPRPQEIDAVRAELRAAEATVRIAEVQLAHTKLYAPADGLVMTRMIEPGTVVRPGAAVYSVAIAGEVWVRAFAPEMLRGRVAPNTEVRITDDGAHAWRGRIGYVFPVAESQPQPVYRLRIRVENPDGALRQGMPVTITLPAAPGA